MSNFSKVSVVSTTGPPDISKVLMTRKFESHSMEYLPSLVSYMYLCTDNVLTWLFGFGMLITEKNISAANVCFPTFIGEEIHKSTYFWSVLSMTSFIILKFNTSWFAFGNFWITDVLFILIATHELLGNVQAVCKGIPVIELLNFKSKHPATRSASIMELEWVGLIFCLKIIIILEHS